MFERWLNRSDDRREIKGKKLSASPYIGRKHLEEMGDCIARDEWSWCDKFCLHVNIGRFPEVGVETVSQGFRNLKPVVSPEAWPQCVPGIRILLNTFMLRLSESSLPDRCIIHLYSPFLEFKGSKGFGAKIIHAEDVRLCRDDENYRNRRFSIIPFFAGNVINVKLS